MKVNFYLKEDDELLEDSITITVVRKNKKNQTITSNKLDDLTAVEQQNIKHIISTIEKYSCEEDSIKINSI